MVYGLVDPRTLLVFYVGKSSRGIARAYQHACPSTRENPDTRAVLVSLGYAYNVVVLEQSARGALNDAERWWIAFGRACGWPLTNKTDGGEGMFAMHESSRALMRAVPLEVRAAASRLGRERMTPERRREIARKISDALGPEGLSARARTRAAHMAPERRQEIAAKIVTTYTSERRSEATRRRWANTSPEQRRQHMTSARAARGTR